MAYYSVRHTETGELFREEAASKNWLKRNLTRFNGVEYCSFWSIDQVDLQEWNRLKRQRISTVPSHYWSK